MRPPLAIRLTFFCSMLTLGINPVAAQEKGFDLEVEENYSVQDLLEMEQKETLHKDTGKKVIVTGIVSEKGMSHNMETGEFMSTVLLKTESGEFEDEEVECLPEDEEQIDPLKEGMKIKVAGELTSHVGARVRYAQIRVVEE